MDRRTVIAAAAALPVAGVSVAGTAPVRNATDGAWRELQAATAALEAASRGYNAFEATLPEHLKLSAHPSPLDRGPDEWQERLAAWSRGRAELGAEAPGEKEDQAADLLGVAEEALIDTPAATLVDVERKLSVLHGIANGSIIQRDDIGGLLADVRALNREAAA